MNSKCNLNVPLLLFRQLRSTIFNSTLEYTSCFGLQSLGTKKLINRFLFTFPVASSQSYKLNFFGNVFLL